ncbi:MAG: NADH-quinone oxidoreductase subunit C [Myxococcales bacterium]|nr:NADH-quinone oxidoreductase subunit C [Myxococcales bacterium]
MSKKVITRLQKELGDVILETASFRGDEEVVVAPKHWVSVATFLRDDPELSMDHFTDLTAVDWPEREMQGEPRFDVLLLVRSLDKKHRIRVKTYVKDGEKLPTLTTVWPGANWAEREVWDMFGIAFEGHKDLRRILLYEEFEGFPLRKDYPIDRVQPLVEYRDVDDTLKLPPFGIEEGQPFARIDWEARLAGRDEQVSPAIGLQVGQRRALSDSEVAEAQAEELAAARAGES